MPIFELDRFRPVERHHLERQDHLLVNSWWAKQVLFDNAVMPSDCISVVPLGGGRDIITNDQGEMYGTNAFAGQPTTFMNVGKWEVRKGHDVLIDAFCKAFTPADNVRLILACHNPCAPPEYSARWRARVLACPMAGSILMCPRFDTQEELAATMRLADCGAFPARAEGWNLDAAEMLAMGKHLILTDYSAHTEWANADVARLIQVDDTEPAHDGVWFKSDLPEWQGEPGRWAKLGSDQVDQLVAHLREVHRLKQSWGLGFNWAGCEHMKQFTWQAAAAKVMEALA